MNGEISWIGKVGREYSLEQGQEAARDSALMVLACIKEAVGDLDNVREIVSIKGYMNVDPDFTDVSACLNGASELFIELFGDSVAILERRSAQPRCRSASRSRSRGFSRSNRTGKRGAYLQRSGAVCFFLSDAVAFQCLRPRLNAPISMADRKIIR